MMHIPTTKSSMMDTLYIVTFENESRVYTTETAAKECATILGKNAVVTIGALYR